MKPRRDLFERHTTGLRPDSNRRNSPDHRSARRDPEAGGSRFCPDCPDCLLFPVWPIKIKLILNLRRFSVIADCDGDAAGDGPLAVGISALSPASENRRGVFHGSLLKPGLFGFVALFLFAAFLAGPALDLTPLTVTPWPRTTATTAMMAMTGDDGDTGDGDTADQDTIVLGGIPGAGVVVNAEGVLTMKAAVDATGQLSRRQRSAGAGRAGSRPSPSQRVAEGFAESTGAGDRAAIGSGTGTDRRDAVSGGIDRIAVRVFLSRDERHRDCRSGRRHDVGRFESTGRHCDRAGHPAIGRSRCRIASLWPRAKPVGTVGVSIDPTSEGLTRMQHFLSQFGRRAVPADTRTDRGRPSKQPGTADGHRYGDLTQHSFRQCAGGSRLPNEAVGIGLEVRR